MSKKPPVTDQIEMKIGRMQLAVILEEHLNEKVLRTNHRVVDVITHKQGDFGITVMVEPNPDLVTRAEPEGGVGDED